MIEDKVKANGGEYAPDLTRQVTHLIVSKPEGKKYSAARRWDVCCVSIEWLHDSVERGMILNEECYDPTLPPEERGKGAWSRRDIHRISLGKRAREESIISAEGARRKLRKSASMRMNSQSNSIWGDILNQSAGDLSRPDSAPRESSAPTAPATSDDPGPTEAVTSATETPELTAQPLAPPPRDRNWPALRKGVFDGCRFFVHGFPASKEQILFGFLTSHSGQLSTSLEDVASSHHTEPLNQRYLLVPQTSQPDSHPQLPEGVHIITEFFIERCIHNKALSSPTDHVWGQPFPRFPIDGFQSLTICTAGFVNEQLNQIEKTVTQLGASYSEKLNRQVSLLICPDLASLREQKRDLAIYHNIRIVSVEWLWQCITTGCLVPWDGFQFEELLRSADAIRAKLRRREEDKKKGREVLNRSRSEPVITKPPVANPGRRAPAPPPRAGVDRTAFESDTPIATHDTASLQRQDIHESHYETAPTHPHGLDDAITTAPLSETTTSDLNKAASSPKQSQPEDTLKRFPTQGEVGDSEAGEESDATTRKEPPSSDLETERKRKAQQAKDLERLELSKRLSSLMADDAAQEGSGPPRPGRRKRQILGRAASNVSVTSTGSADSGLVLSGSGPRTRQLASLPTASTSAETEFDKFLEHGKDHDAESENPPPATQLGYEDPQAKKYRQVVVGKMMGRGKLGGRSKSESSKSEGGSKEEGQERLRVTDLPASANTNGTKETGPTRRTTRRQGR